MYFINNNEDGLSKQNLPTSGGTAISITSKKQTLFEMLTGEEKPLSIGGLLLVLVLLLLHLWGALWLLKPVEPITLAQPLMMEFSLVPVPGEKPTTAPSAPVPPKAIEPVKPPIQPQKPPVKKSVKKKLFPVFFGEEFAMEFSGRQAEEEECSFEK